jgi:DNA-directed RNA polymerase subunit RPC12/RpoP
MTGICLNCGKVFDGTEEETNGPECACSRECLNKLRGITSDD